MVDRRSVSLFYILKEMNLWSQNFRLSDKERESQLWDVVYRRGFSYLFINNRYSFLFPLSVNYLGKKWERKQLVRYQSHLINSDHKLLSSSLKGVSFGVVI